jgi:hypothetical protein
MAVPSLAWSWLSKALGSCSITCSASYYVWTKSVLECWTREGIVGGDCRQEPRPVTAEALIARTYAQTAYAQT